MDRRKAIKNIAIGLGGVLSATTIGVLVKDFVLTDAAANSTGLLTAEEAFLAEFSDVLIPTTKSSPGAKAAGVGTFIPMMIAECYPTDIQEIFKNGMKSFQEKCVTSFGKEFQALSVEERIKMVEEARKESLVDIKKPSFFILARDLSILGYFSSEIGCTQARAYLPVPGRFDGSAEYKPGQKAWAT